MRDAVAGSDFIARMRGLSAADAAIRLAQASRHGRIAEAALGIRAAITPTAATASLFAARDRSSLAAKRHHFAFITVHTAPMIKSIGKSKMATASWRH